jgi:RNA polymerase sigma factor (sigma-70 family)
MSGKFTYTEPELVEQLKGNSQDAFEYLYNRYSAALYGVILKVVKNDEKAEDAMQDTFLKIWRNIGSYNPDKGTLFTWILNIARNTAIDKMRMEARMSQNICWEFVNETELVPAAIFNPAVSLIDVRTVVASMFPNRRLLIEMVYFEGYTHEELAEKLQMPLGTVKSRIRKGLGELRQIYGKGAASINTAI